MKFCDFEKIMSAKRMGRYVTACGGDTRKALSLYRLNLRLSSEMLSVISCYEVALRNAIDAIATNELGPDWIRDAILPGGIFDNPKFSGTTRMMKKAYAELSGKGIYSPAKMLSAMEFGVWKYMYATPQFKATGRNFLKAFPNKPKSTPTSQINNQYIFNELDAINRLRNRIAHHEPICFLQNGDTISTFHLMSVYNKIYTLFSWMGIEGKSLLYGLDHIKQVTAKIEGLNRTYSI